MIPSDSMREEILAHIQSQFHIAPIYPWSLLPEYAVLRHPKSSKWFALLMTVEGSKLGLTAGRVYDVLDVRCAESDMAEYLEKAGFLPAYHMSRSTWITILLNGSVSFPLISALLSSSFYMTREKTDLDDAFEKSSIELNLEPLKNENPSYADVRNERTYIEETAENGDLKQNTDVHFTTGYKDQPLSFGGRKREEALPERLQQMRAIYNVLDRSPNSEALYFYKQGKFMEDYEESFAYTGKFLRYYPTYHVMTPEQLRGYFSWRTQYRSGNREDTPLSFLYVYLYELLCNIGVKDPEEGYQKILDLDAQYGAADLSFHEHIRAWSKDYIVYYDLPREYLQNTFDTKMDDALSVVAAFESSFSGEGHSLEENNKTEDTHKIFSAIGQLSAYDLAQSVFYKKYPEDTEQVVVRVYRALSLFYKTHDKPMLLERLFGRKGKYPYHMFHSAIFYDHLHYEEYEYRISDAHFFQCKDGHWTCEMYFRAKDKSKELGQLYREVDRLLRKKYLFPRPLRQKLDQPMLLQIIDEEITHFLEEKKEAENPKIQIDFSRLSQIRKDAAHTRDQLIVEEEEFIAGERFANEKSAAEEIPEEALLPPMPPMDIAELERIDSEKTIKEPDHVAEPEAESAASPVSLTTEQKEVLHLLLDGQDVQGYVSSHHLMLSILIDEINEAFYEEIGDTILEFAGNDPVLIEDYTEDVKKIVSLFL